MWLWQLAALDSETKRKQKSACCKNVNSLFVSKTPQTSRPRERPEVKNGKGKCTAPPHSPRQSPDPPSPHSGQPVRANIILPVEGSVGRVVVGWHRFGFSLRFGGHSFLDAAGMRGQLVKVKENRVSFHYFIGKPIFCRRRVPRKKQRETKYLILQFFFQQS